MPTPTEAAPPPPAAARVFRVCTAFAAAAWCLGWYTAAWLAGAAWGRMKAGWTHGNNPTPDAPPE